VSGAETLVIGLGNRLRGDDAAGPEVARLLRERAPEVRAIEHEREPSDLIELWEEGVGLTVVIDAVQGEEPGRIHRVEVGREELRERRSAGASTHALALGEVIELARVLDRLPTRLVVFGIEGTRFDTGADLSPAVRRAAVETIELVLAELGEAERAPPAQPAT
jgi:hydrogenase maturation protease